MSRFSTFRIGSHLFGVDVTVVQEIVRVGSITPVPLVAPGVAGLINLRGEVLTAIDLRMVLGLGLLPSPSQGISADSLNGANSVHVVVRVDDEPISLLVDAIDAVIEVGGLSAEPVPSTVQESLRALIVGVFLLPDRLLLALDVHALLAEAGLVST